MESLKNLWKSIYIELIRRRIYQTIRGNGPEAMQINIVEQKDWLARTKDEGWESDERLYFSSADTLILSISTLICDRQSFLLFGQ